MARMKTLEVKVAAAFVLVLLALPPAKTALQEEPTTLSPPVGYTHACPDKEFTCPDTTTCCKLGHNMG